MYDDEDDQEQNVCTCRTEDIDPHTCPFSEEINDNYDLCTCCEYCTRQCWLDI